MGQPHGPSRFIPHHRSAIISCLSSGAPVRNDCKCPIEKLSDDVAQLIYELGAQQTEPGEIAQINLEKFEGYLLNHFGERKI